MNYIPDECAIASSHLVKVLHDPPPVVIQEYTGKKNKKWDLHKVNDPLKGL